MRTTTKSLSELLTMVVVVMAKATGWSSTILGLYLLGLVLAMRKCRDDTTKSRVGVRYHYCGLQVIKSVNNTLSQNIKRAAEQDIISRRAKDVDLQIKRDVAKDAGDVTSQSERLIHGAVSTLHVQNNARVVGNAKIVSDFSRHQNDLGATICNAFYFLTISDQEHDGPN